MNLECKLCNFKTPYSTVMEQHLFLHHGLLNNPIEPSYQIVPVESPK